MPYTLNGQAASIAEPNLKDGTLWVPLRAVSESLGGNVDWDPDNRVAIVYLGSNIATLKIGDAEADVNGEKSPLQEAPYLENGETWVPVRFFNRVGQQIAVNLQDKHVEMTTVGGTAS